MRRIIHSNGVITYSFDQFAELPVSVHVSTRHGGVSPTPWDSLNFSVKRGDTMERVRANRLRLADALAIQADKIVSCQQIHSRTVVKVDGDDAGTMQKGADGLATDSALLPLSLVFADCVPIVLYDARKHVLGVCHSGWRGTVQGVALSTLQTMIHEYGVEPTDVYAGIGPSIGPQSYEVGDEVIDAVRASFDDANQLIAYRSVNGAAENHVRAYFNLWEANRTMLVNGGVPPGQIELSGIDTATNTQDFYSHRAEQGQCGLFSMVSWLHAVD